MSGAEGLASRLRALEDEAAGRDRRQPLLETLVAPGETPATVTDRICHLVLRPHTPIWWWAAFGTALLMLGVGAISHRLAVRPRRLCLRQ